MTTLKWIVAKIVAKYKSDKVDFIIGVVSALGIFWILASIANVNSGNMLPGMRAEHPIAWWNFLKVTGILR